MEKKCFKCKKKKDISEFYKHPQMADGHLGKCIECTKKEAIENRSSNVEYYRAYDRKRDILPERRASLDESIRRQKKKDPVGFLERTNKAKRKYIKSNPEKRKAHIILGNAIRDGKIERQPCEVCGNKKSEGHHEDYSKPLDVRWLCRKHHGEIHRRK